MEEVMVPVDFSWNGVISSNIIAAADLLTIFKKVPPGAKLWFLPDACYSAGLLEKGFVALVFSVPCRPKSFPLSPEAEAFRAQSTDVKRMAASVEKSQELNVAMLAACGQDEKAMDCDFTDHPNGAFTAGLLALLGQNQGTPTPDAVATSLGATLTPQFHQTPEPRGNAAIRGQPFFAI
jgi:hypothetical protein